MSFNFPLYVATKLLKIEQKQSHSTVIVGMKGDGKSYTGMGIAEQTSILLSKIFYQNTVHARDFFNINHVAIIDPKDIRSLMKKAVDRYHIYHYDDIAYAWNTRDWAKKGNKIMNAWFAFQRGFGNETIVTIQSDRFQDSQSRGLFNDLIEMSKDHKYMDRGVAMGKDFDIVLKNRGSKPQFYTYKWRESVKYDDLETIKPSQALWEQYDKIRDVKMKAFNDMAFKLLEDLDEAEANAPSKNERPAKVSSKELLRQLLIDNPNMSYSEAVRNGYKNSLGTFYKNRSEFNMSPSTLQVTT